MYKKVSSSRPRVVSFVQSIIRDKSHLLIFTNRSNDSLHWVFKRGRTVRGIWCCDVWLVHSSSPISFRCDAATTNQCAMQIWVSLKIMLMPRLAQLKMTSPPSRELGNAITINKLLSSRRALLIVNTAYICLSALIKWRHALSSVLFASLLRTAWISVR
jgi:hypothetical protein